MPYLSKRQAYDILRRRGNRDRRGRWVKNKAKYVAGMQKKASGGYRRRTYRRSYRRRRY